MNTWAILTGEYPPQEGGVSDYTYTLAHGLASCGDEVHVWAPPCEAVSHGSTRVHLHRLPDRYGFRSLTTLSRELNRLPGELRIMVQYVPHAFGMKAMNAPFCMWLGRRPEPIWVMFHEVALPYRHEQSWKYNALANVTRWTASRVADSAERVFVSTPAWARLLKRLSIPAHKITWLPVPSNLPTSVDRLSVSSARRRMLDSAEGRIVGHFGSYGPHVAEMLQEILPRLLRRDCKCRVRLIGRNSQQYFTKLSAGFPDVADRIQATGAIPARHAATQLAACDCLIQPYPDGITTRRTSTMAGLGLGMPIISNRGELTDDIWSASQAVDLVPSFSAGAFVEQIEHVLNSTSYRAALARRAAQLYDTTFAMECSIRTLQSYARRLKPISGTIKGRGRRQAA